MAPPTKRGPRPTLLSPKLSPWQKLIFIAGSPILSVLTYSLLHDDLSSLFSKALARKLGGYCSVLAALYCPIFLILMSFRKDKGTRARAAKAKGRSRARG